MTRRRRQPAERGSSVRRDAGHLRGAGAGFLTAKDDHLTMTAPGVELPLTASRPKVYRAVGNCLTGVVNTGRDSFKNSYALAWMKNGTKQYIGAVQSTWYELNWNMADWFLKQEGRWTFSESLFLLRQWPNYLLAEGVVSGRDREGAEFTDGIFVLYGDPAHEGRVGKAREPALSEALDIVEAGGSEVVRMTSEVKVDLVGEGNKRTAEKHDGWRTFRHLLPCRVTEVKVEETDFASVVLPGETIIRDAGQGLKVGDESFDGVGSAEGAGSRPIPIANHHLSTSCSPGRSDHDVPPLGQVPPIDRRRLREMVAQSLLDPPAT